MLGMPRGTAIFLIVFISVLVIAIVVYYAFLRKYLNRLSY